MQELHTQYEALPQGSRKGQRFACILHQWQVRDGSLLAEVMCG